MRLWQPADGFTLQRPLVTALPDLPAAVPIYRASRRRAGRRIAMMLVLDLDAKRHGSAAVLTDYLRLTAWIADAGGRYIADVSTSGGRHIIVPLATGVTAAEVRPLLDALAARCPTLDRTPMCNDQAGCITVPGSLCREGGHRQLIGSLSEAVSAFTDRSDPQFLHRLHHGLGLPPRQPRSAPAPTPASPASSAFDGAGDHRRLRAAYRRHGTPHPDITRFAETGQLPADGRWPSRSEARQAVLVAAALHGMSLHEVLASTAPGQPWHRGLGAAYAKYRHPSGRVSADWHRACDWVEQHLRNLQQSTHKNKRTGGGGEAPGCLPAHRTWLAHANTWCSIALRSSATRATAEAILQALAAMAAQAGHLVNGVPTVGVGGRALSLCAGLLAESTVWSALRRLRETPGSPVLLIRRGSGPDADLYALVTPSITDNSPSAPGRPRVAAVHPAWSVIGHHHRRIYELVTTDGITTVAGLTVVARASASAVYDSLAELARYGLVQRSRGHVCAGKVELDDIAEAHRLDEEWTDRVAAHRHARQLWHQWLNQRHDFGQPDLPVPPETTGDHYEGSPPDEHYLAAVMATGPPTSAE